jgi:phage host-nuclease inhibitor protein Gam
MSKKPKTKALSQVPQSREDAVVYIGRIGTIRRQIASLKAVSDEAIRVAGEKFEADSAALADELASLETGVHTWCEANRTALTNDNKVKFHDFGTGSIKWRMLPPSVSLRAVENVIEQCRKVGFLQFIRTKDEVNKEAMLTEPDKARLIPGVTIKSGGEEFSIEPAELETSLTAKAGA